MTPADTLRDVIARLERGHSIGGGDAVYVSLKAMCNDERFIPLFVRAFCGLDLNAIAEMEREVLPGWDGIILRGVQADGSTLVIASLREGDGVEVESGRITGPDTEARARLIALCKAKLQELEVADAAP